ncbi:MAG: hypothetical protein AB1384_14645 [Actinomycetota bacterium]
MAVWAMLIGMATLINITMVGAMVSLAGNVPDSSFLAILSRYLADKGSPPGTVLYPVEAAARLERLRRRVHAATAVAAAAAAALSLWALFDGWGAVAMSAVTLWMLAANLTLLGIPLGLWSRRAGKIGEEDVEEAWKKSRPAQREEAAGGGGPDGPD